MFSYTNQDWPQARHHDSQVSKDSVIKLSLSTVWLPCNSICFIILYLIKIWGIEVVLTSKLLPWHVLYSVLESYDYMRLDSSTNSIAPWTWLCSHSSLMKFLIEISILQPRAMNPLLIHHSHSVLPNELIITILVIPKRDDVRLVSNHIDLYTRCSGDLKLKDHMHLYP